MKTKTYILLHPNKTHVVSTNVYSSLETATQAAAAYDEKFMILPYIAEIKIVA
jgi:hypothetical protein